MKIGKEGIAPFLLETADIFGGKSREYIIEKVFGKHLLELEWILQNCGNSGRVLDVGGGLGINLITLKKINKNLDVHLIDKLEEYEGTNSLENPIGSIDVGLKILKDHEVNLVKEDFWEAKELPFDSGFFDVVTCFDVIEHFPQNPLPLLREMKRILKDGGTLIMCAPNLLSTARRSRLMLGIHPYMHFDLWMAEKYDKYYGHYREYTRKEYHILLERSGFSQIKTFMVSEPTRTKAFNSYHHKKYRKLSLPAIGLWLIYPY
ncbi:MAG: class I SAM-dependent methyltransferase [Candidatus Brocadiaceae bacterium]|nr:class I SAM-dependent methyltransferase [Candidatus Brocadiaceae bacterium]